MRLSRAFAVTVLALAGVGCEDERMQYPIVPGGGGGGGSTLPDAAVDDGDASGTFTGRVCLVTDARALSSCAPSGAGGLTVAVGTLQATTTDDGSFVMMRPSGANLAWSVTGDAVVRSIMDYSAAITTVPAIDANTYNDMLAATQAVLAGGSGAIIARVTRNGTPVPNLVATPSPQPDSQVYYDGIGPLAWELDATGAAGVVWVPSILAGNASITFDDGIDLSFETGIPVADQAVTFVFHGRP